MKKNKGKYRGVVYVYNLVMPKSKKNGYKYVGVTLDESERRRKWNSRSTRNYGGKKVEDAREKYGPKAFSYHVLEVHYGDDKEKLKKFLEKDRETYFIERFDSVDHGFNESRGGTGNKGRLFSQEHRDKIGAKSKGRKHSQATKAIISQKLKGHVVTPETRAKISRGQTGKKRTDQQKEAQSARQKGIEPKAATEAAKKWVKENGGGYWKGRTFPDDIRANMKAAQQLRGTSVQAIAPDGTTKDYTTMLDAAKDLGMNVGSVGNNLKSGGICKNGYRFKRL